MGLELREFIQDFALGFVRADAKKPQAINARSKEAFQPGIGPHAEAQAVRLVIQELEGLSPEKYAGRLATGVPYPHAPRQKCDLCIGASPEWDWAIEVKMLRFLGDNGNVNDNILMHILSPYPEHRSGLTDCLKLSQSSLGSRKAVLIYGFDHVDWPLEPAIEAFEALAEKKVQLGPRVSAVFEHLVHPVHNRGQVFGWEIRA